MTMHDLKMVMVKNSDSKNQDNDTLLHKSINHILALTTTGIKKKKKD